MHSLSDHRLRSHFIYRPCRAITRVVELIRVTRSIPLEMNSASRKKQSSQKFRKKNDNKPAEEMDQRFAAVLVDPRFKSMKKTERKVKIDSRFKGMFNEKRFKLKSSVDKRGQPVAREADEDLKSYYDLPEEEEETNEVEEDETVDEEKEEEQVELPSPSKKPLSKKKGNKKRDKFVPDARGEDSDAILSSSSDESSDDEDNDIDHQWGELDRDVERNENTSRRVAICNADWDRIKAEDLFVLLNSFKPENGTIESVKVYTSEFGKERLAQELIEGPAEIKATPLLEDSDDSNDGLTHKEEDAESEFMTEQLRKYQLNRLKYFYAIAEFDSERTAVVIYDELDGFEYESSATTLDIRFVPDEMVFDDEPVQVCTCLPDLSAYKAPQFITTALQQSKVQLTWDETDPKRKEKIDKAYQSKDESAMQDLEAYLASSASESSDEDENSDDNMQGEKSSNFDKVEKYRRLLASLDEENEEEKGDEPEMEITFDTGDEDEDKDEEQDDADSEKLEEDNDEGAPLGQLSEEEEKAEETRPERSRSTKNKKRKHAHTESDKNNGVNTELGLLVMDDEDDKHHFDYTKYVKDDAGKKKKKKRADTEKKDEFNVDLDDPRFNKIYTSHLYNIDPSDPHFKKTEAMEKLLDKKLKTACTQREELAHQEKKKEASGDSSIDPSILGLVASVKASTKRLESNKRNRR